MSFKISINAPGMNISATLKDEALPKLIELSQEFRDEAGAVHQMIEPPTASSKDAPLTSNSEEAVKGYLKDYGAAELLNRLRWTAIRKKYYYWALGLKRAVEASRGKARTWTRFSSRRKRNRPPIFQEM